MTTWFLHGGKGTWDFLIFDWNVHQVDDAKEFADSNNIPINFKWPNGIYGQVDERTRQELQSRLFLS